MYSRLGYTPEDTAWLQTEYQTVMGYPGDPAGLDYWGKNIDAYGRAAVHQSFLQAAGKTAVVKNDSGGADVVTAPSSFFSGISNTMLIGGGVAALGLLMLLGKKH